MNSPAAAQPLWRRGRVSSKVVRVTWLHRPTTQFRSCDYLHVPKLASGTPRKLRHQRACTTAATLPMRPASAGRSREAQFASVIARPGSGRDSPVRSGKEIPTHPFGQNEENSAYKPQKREVWRGKMPSATRATAERIISEKTAAGDAAAAGGGCESNDGQRVTRERERARESARARGSE